MVMLHEIRNVNSHLGTFIAKGLTIIHDVAMVGRWRHAKSADNLALLCSYGMTKLRPLKI